MFRNLLSFWKGRHFLDEVYNEFRQMLEDAERMFVMVCDALLRNSNKPDLMQKIHDADKGINKLQREVRKRIIEHLTLQPAVDVSACLILMSLVKDGEGRGLLQEPVRGRRTPRRKESKGVESWPPCSPAAVDWVSQPRWN
ncbi:MAG: PhoU domain-containing protein [Phycisphaerales bacterium]|nr:MAG: PhoU domain-containing protein [Phycisphaerales bacterium]